MPGALLALFVTTVLVVTIQAEPPLNVGLGDLGIGSSSDGGYSSSSSLSSSSSSSSGLDSSYGVPSAPPLSDGGYSSDDGSSHGHSKGAEIIATPAAKGVRYAGPIVYTNEKPPVIHFPPPPKPKKGGYGKGGKGGKPKMIKYVPLPHHDLPILIYQSDINPPIHVVSPPPGAILDHHQAPAYEAPTGGTFSSTFSSSADSYGPPADTYGAPKENSIQASSYLNEPSPVSAPSDSYGAPSSGPSFISSGPLSDAHDKAQHPVDPNSVGGSVEVRAASGLPFNQSVGVSRRGDATEVAAEEGETKPQRPVIVPLGDLVAEESETSVVYAAPVPVQPAVIVPVNPVISQPLAGHAYISTGSLSKGSLTAPAPQGGFVASAPPPQANYGAPSAPSSDYGAHSAPPSSDYGATSAPASPSVDYGAPLTAPATQQYGAPSGSSNDYGAPSTLTLSSQYGAPSGPSSDYGAPSGGLALSSQYGAPSAPSADYGAPSSLGISSQYGAPSGPSTFTVSSQYGAPSSGLLSSAYGVPVASYGPPSSSKGSSFKSSGSYLKGDSGIPSFKGFSTLKSVSYGPPPKKAAPLPHIIYTGHPPIHIFQQPPIYMSAPPSKAQYGPPPKASYGPPPSKGHKSSKSIKSIKISYGPPGGDYGFKSSGSGSSYISSSSGSSNGGWLPGNGFKSISSYKSSSSNSNSGHKSQGHHHHPPPPHHHHHHHVKSAFSSFSSHIHNSISNLHSNLQSLHSLHSAPKFKYGPPPQKAKSSPKYVVAPKAWNKPPIIIYQGVRPPVTVYEKPSGGYSSSYSIPSGSFSSSGGYSSSSIISEIPAASPVASPITTTHTVSPIALSPISSGQLVLDNGAGQVDHSHVAGHNIAPGNPAAQSVDLTYGIARISSEPGKLIDTRKQFGQLVAAGRTIFIPNTSVTTGNAATTKSSEENPTAVYVADLTSAGQQHFTILRRSDSLDDTLMSEVTALKQEAKEKASSGGVTVAPLVAPVPLSSTESQTAPVQLVPAFLTPSSSRSGNDQNIPASYSSVIVASAGTADAPANPETPSILSA